MRIKLLAAVAATGLAVAFASPAAATEFVSVTKTISSINAPNTAVVSFDQFDSSLGTLQSVALSFSLNSSTKVTVTNNSTMNRTWTVTGNSGVTLAGNGFSLSDAFTLPSGTTIAIGPRLAPSNPSSASATYNASYADSDTLTSGLGAFTGSGTISFLLSPTGIFGATGMAGSPTIGASAFGGDATLTYNYEKPAPQTAAVPEPGTWAMMIAGFGFAGVTFRRRSSAKAGYAA